MSPNGFCGMVMTSQGRIFIDPVNINDDVSRYQSKLRTGASTGTAQPFQCDVHTLSEKKQGYRAKF